jgi:hypothetical protein
VVNQYLFPRFGMFVTRKIWQPWLTSNAFPVHNYISCSEEQRTDSLYAVQVDIQNLTNKVKNSSANNGVRKLLSDMFNAWLEKKIHGVRLSNFTPGLPDGIFSNKQSQFGNFFECLERNRLVYSSAIWNILRSFGIFYGHLVI